MNTAIPLQQLSTEYSPEERFALARLMCALFNQWTLSLPEQATLLGLSAKSRATLHGMHKGDKPLPDGRDVLDRAGHLLGIAKSLGLLFPENPEIIAAWMKGRQPALENEAPLEIIEKHGLLGLAWLRNYLDFLRGQ